MENKLHSTISAPEHLHTLKQIVKLNLVAGPQSMQQNVLQYLYNYVN